jgi:hypothetical protein
VHDLAPRIMALLREYICAARVGVWLCRIAVSVRSDSLPALCRRASACRPISAGRLDLARVVAIVARVCQLPLFSVSCFPRPCLRQSLALYRELTRMGYPAAIHFGVRRDGSDLAGHCWVTVNGVPVAEPQSISSLSVTYSHSAFVM